MAKNLILNALVDNLGTYVEDLKKEHLKLSLSTGLSVNQTRPRHPPIHASHHRGSIIHREYC